MAKTLIELDVEPTQIDALKVYLGHKNTTIEVELVKHISTLYSKNVPATVREYISESMKIAANERRSEALDNPV